MGELGLFEDLPACLISGEPFVEYSVVEHRYENQFPNNFRGITDRHPHRRAELGTDYTASMFIVSALSRLEREGVLLKKFGERLAARQRDGEVSYWALAPTPGDGDDITWEAFARDLGIEP